MEGADPVEVDLRLVVPAVLADSMEAAVRLKKPLICDSVVCGDAAVIGKVAGKLHGVVLAGSAAVVCPGEGVSILVHCAQDAHLLPGQPTLHLLDSSSKAGITSTADTFAARIHICLVQFNLSEEDFIIQNLLKDAHQAMAHVECGLHVHSNLSAGAPETLSAEGVQNQRLPLVDVLVGMPCQASTVICEPPST